MTKNEKCVKKESVEWGTEDMILEIDTVNKKVSVVRFDDGEVFYIDKISEVLEELSQSLVEPLKIKLSPDAIKQVNQRPF